MRAVSRGERKARTIGAVAAIVCVALGIGAVLALVTYIDHKLNQSAENQVVAFTDQAAANVGDRMYMVQSAVGSFTVQSSDPADLVPALAALCERHGFAHAAAVGMDGEGLLDDGTPFSTRQIMQEETALSRQAQSYSDTFVNDDGVRVRLAQTPLYLNGAQIGALYVQIPFSMFTMPAKLDMFDGRGYFMLFDAGTGEILVTPQEGTKTPVEGGMTIFEFLEEASRYEAPTTFDSSEEASSALLALQAQQEGDVLALQGTVDRAETGLTTAVVDGKASYVCVSPVGTGKWYVCSVVPMQNVRAEASVVTTTFQVVFIVMLACLIVVGLLVFSAYRKRVRDRNVAMMGQLYAALSESIDLSVNLYSPSDKKVTPIVEKTAAIIGHRMADFLQDGRLAASLGLSETGSALFDRIRAGSFEGLERGEFSFLRPQDARERWVAYSVKPLVFEGKPQLLVVLRDATAEKEAQLSMKDARDAAEAANKAKSEFLSRMSHEIRTPMNVIIGMLQIAQGSVGDADKMKESLVKIGAASDHLLGLINDVLDLSKIENGKATLSNEPFRLSSLFAQVTTVARAQCEQKGQELAVSGPDRAAGILVGDAVRLKQMLINLLTNAAKYTPEGGHIRFETTVAPGSALGRRSVTFVVADDGIGMSEEFVRHVFDPFTMEGRSHEQGTGLGMSIVRTIVSMMGGDLSVESELNRGTTFVVTLDLRIAFEAERRALEELEGYLGEGAARLGLGAVPADGRCAAEGAAGPPPSAANAAPAAFDPRDLEGLRALVVEDNDLNAEIACELLAGSGLATDRAADGEEACELFAASPEGYYDVILMDVQMPRLNGYEASRRIRALDRADASRVAIIAMSANAFSDDVEASLESGMNAHLPKPIDIRRVLSTIAKFVRARRAGEADS